MQLVRPTCAKHTRGAVFSFWIVALAASAWVLTLTRTAVELGLKHWSVSMHASLINKELITGFYFLFGFQ